VKLASRLKTLASGPLAPSSSESMSALQDKLGRWERTLNQLRKEAKKKTLSSRRSTVETPWTK